MIIDLPTGKKLYFASDFHLGAPNKSESRIREQKIIRWLESVQSDAAAIFLVGDLFDFWFEYQKTIPKGFARFQGKIAALTDGGLPVYFFTGNHDLWSFEYFDQELGVKTFREPLRMQCGGKSFLIGHGDGLGPGDYGYKQLKKIFTNKTCEKLFNWLHPDLGVRLATGWSMSRKDHPEAFAGFKGDDEWLWSYCKEAEEKKHTDYYVFGHRHCPLDLPVGESGSRYLNLGEWMRACTYAVFDGERMSLEKFDMESTTV